jgi:DNA-damage-inducible protein J
MATHLTASSPALRHATDSTDHPRENNLTVSQLRYRMARKEDFKMAGPTSMVHVRVDDDIKARATETLNSLGLSVSDAVRLFLHRVVADQAFPLELKVPNARTRAAMAEADEIARTHRARFATADELFADLEKTSSK